MKYMSCLQYQFNLNVFNKKFKFSSYYPFDALLGNNFVEISRLNRILKAIKLKEEYLSNYIKENYKWFNGDSIYDFNSIIKILDYENLSSIDLANEINSVLDLIISKISDENQKFINKESRITTKECVNKINHNNNVNKVIKNNKVNVNVISN